MSGLAGLQVVDFSTGFAGVIASMVLADHGATVVRIEPPAGDPDRELPAWAQWRRGQQSVVADLATAEGRQRARALAEGADVLLESWLPGEAEPLGLDAASLSVANPGLVHCSITGFGPTGPFAGIRGYDAVVSAKAGVMNYQDGDRPRFPAVRGASFAAAQGALQGIFAALYVRDRIGRGQHVETSLLQGLTPYDLYDWLGPQLPASFAGRPYSGANYSVIHGMNGFTKDGCFLEFSNYMPHLLAAFLEALELTEAHAEAVGRGAAPEELREMVLRRLYERTLDEWMETFLRSDDIGFEPYRTPVEALDHPQMVYNGDVLQLDDPVLGPTRQLGPLVRMSLTPAQPTLAAPRLGQHTVSAFVPWTPPAPPSEPAGAGPLAGVTILELAWFYAAPFGVAMLADLGARVIKVEDARGDPHRHQGMIDEYAGVKALAGKESVVLDYRLPEGQEVLHRLAAKSDMVMRNYRPQSAQATSDEALRPFNPDLVYLYAGAYGSDGPYATRPAFAGTMAIAGGVRAFQLGWDAAIGRRVPFTFEEGLERLGQMRYDGGALLGGGDPTAAVCVGTAMALGLLVRQRTGHGQHLETSMLCSNAYLVSEACLDFEGRDGRPHHDADGAGPLYRLYPTSRGWVFLAVTTPAEWEAFCRVAREVTGVDLAGDAPASVSTGRQGETEALVEAISEILGARTAAEWEGLFVPEGVACVEVARRSFSAFTVTDPLMTEAGFVDEVDHPLFGRHRRHGPVVRLSATPAKGGPASTIGQHTRAVLAELGYTDDEITELRAKGVVDWPD